jgi:hypothetical protein
VTGSVPDQLYPRAEDDTVLPYALCFWPENRCRLWASLKDDYIGCIIESVVDILFDNAGLPDCLTPQEHHLDLRLPCHRTTDRVVHNSKIIKPRIQINHPHF